MSYALFQCIAVDSRAEVRKAIFQVPYSGISGQQTLVALAAAEGAVFAANKVTNASGTVPGDIGTTIAPDINDANFTIEVAVAAARAAGINKTCQCRSLHHFVIIIFSYNHKACKRGKNHLCGSASL